MSVRSVFRGAVLAVSFAVSAPVVLAASSFVIASQAEAATLSSIQVRGNARIDAATIRTYITVSPGQSYNQGDLNTSTTRLFNTGFFASVDVSGLDGTIVVTVVENPIVVDVGFVGNQKVGDADLGDVIQMRSRSVFSQATLAADVRRIEDHYASVGRGSVTVTTDVQRLDGNLVSVAYNIAEGDRIRIETIDFVGNEAFSDRQLKSVIETNESNFLSWITKNDIYSADTLAQDEIRLRAYYLQRGYADFQVLSSTASFDQATASYLITITVSEGTRYAFGDIGIDSSIPGVDTATLERFIGTESGHVFNAADLETTLEDMSVALVEQGYAFGIVNARGNRDLTTNEIDLTYLVDQGPRAYVEQIVIVGNTRTRNFVILREFDFAEGDAFNRVLVSRAQRRLQQLNIFASVNIGVEQGSAPDKVVLVVNVEEKRTGEISASAGYSTTDGLILSLGVTETNLLGRGQFLKLQVSGGRTNRNYSVSFTEPYFLGRRISFGVDAYRSTSTATTLRPYDQTSNGGTLRFGLPITDNLGASVNYTFVQQSVTNSTRDDIFPEGNTITSSVGYALTYSTLDSTTDPREGFYFQGAQQFALLGGNNRFIRSTVDGRYYTTIGAEDQFSTMVRARAGNIIGIGQPVRVLDNFFQGGETIRGFATNGYGPRTNDGVALGGRNYWNATVETTFPLPLIPEDFGFRGAVFADAGNLWGVDGPVPPYSENNTIRSSVGASILWASPFGLLRLDFAKALTQDPDDVTQWVRFGFGSSF